jgi:hypothetical protein
VCSFEVAASELTVAHQLTHRDETSECGVGLRVDPTCVSKDSEDTTAGRVALHNGPKGYHCVATKGVKRHASVGAC